MSSARIAAAGKITIPVDVRRDLSLNMGDWVEFVQIVSGCYKLFASTREVGNLKGLFGPAKKHVGVKDMNTAIAARGAKAPWSDSIPKVYWSVSLLSAP